MAHDTSAADIENQVMSCMLYLHILDKPLYGKKGKQETITYAMIGRFSTRREPRMST